MWHFLLYALVIGVIGSAAGVLLGLPLGKWITELYAAELGIPIIETRFLPGSDLAAAALSLWATIVAAIAPARGRPRLLPPRPCVSIGASRRSRARVPAGKGRPPSPHAAPSGSERLPRPTPVADHCAGDRLCLHPDPDGVGLLDSIEFFFTQNYGIIETLDVSVSLPRSKRPPRGNDPWNGRGEGGGAHPAHPCRR